MPFIQSGKTVNLWPGQIPGEGQVQLRQGYKEEPLSAILCLRACLARVSTCLHPLDQEKLPCQDFLSLFVCFWHWRVVNSKNCTHSYQIITIHLILIADSGSWVEYCQSLGHLSSWLVAYLQWLIFSLSTGDMIFSTSHKECLLLSNKSAF
jgi:hypothetical protein